MPGAYHFYTFCRPAADQAANFLAVVPREADALPPVVDVEFGGNCATRPARDTLLAELGVYRDAVEAGLGRRPLPLRHRGPRPSLPTPRHRLGS